MPGPDALVALVCLTIVCKYNPTWVTAPVGDRANESGISRWRVSRIKNAVQSQLVKLVTEVSRRGRRPFRSGA